MLAFDEVNSGLAMDRFTAWLDQQFAVLALMFVSGALILIAGVAILIINRLLRRWLTRVESRIHLPYEFVVIATRLVAGALWLIVALVVLDIWGIGIGGVWTLAVSVATLIGVGFLATWTLISNFTASLLISIWRPFRLGDVIELLPENLKGRVIDRNLVFTAVREDSGDIIEIPNNMLFQRFIRVVGAREKTAFELLEMVGNPPQAIRSAPRARLRAS